MTDPASDALAARLLSAVDLGEGWVEVDHERCSAAADEGPLLDLPSGWDERQIVATADAGPWYHPVRDAVAYSVGAGTSDLVAAHGLFAALVATDAVETMAWSVLADASLGRSDTENIGVVVFPVLDRPGVNAQRAVLAGIDRAELRSVQFTQFVATIERVVVLAWVATPDCPLDDAEVVRISDALELRLRL